MFLFLWHSPLYDLIDETHFIKDIDFWVIINTSAYLDFSTLNFEYVFTSCVKKTSSTRKEYSTTVIYHNRKDVANN